MDDRLRQLVRDLADGTVSPEDGFNSLVDFPSEDLGFACLDHHRVLRQGLPEVVYGEGKTSEQVVAIVARLKQKGHPVLVTRLDEETYRSCGRDLDAGHEIPGHYDSLSRLWTWNEKPISPRGEGSIVVACAGTSDLPVAEEASLVAEAFGNKVIRLTDVGVAGLHRLMDRMDDLRQARVVIAVAGMEGALPSVIAGLVQCPVIAVPTSVGYGTSFGGIAALLAMLNSCASGVTVVNIDNGFGAACAATLINQPLSTPAREQTS